MGHADYAKRGDYNAICDICGFKYKASELKLDWKNAFSCPECWEPRHPQDFLRGVPDKQFVPIARPEGPDVNIGDITPDDL